MATDTDKNPARRIEDRHPDAAIDWSKPEAPAVPLSSTAGPAREGGHGEQESAILPPLTAPAPQPFSEQDIPADAPRAFAKRYSALLEENIRMKAALEAAPAPQTFTGIIDAGAYDRETGMMYVTVKLPGAGLPTELRTIGAPVTIAVSAVQFSTTPAQQTDELRELTEALEKRVRTKAALAPQQSELTDEFKAQVRADFETHIRQRTVPAYNTARHGPAAVFNVGEYIDTKVQDRWIGYSARAAEECRAKAAPAAPVQTAELKEMEARKDAAYLERNQVVAALAKCFPSGVAKTAIEGWSEDWHNCVYVDLPTGQASWHFHDSHAHLFADLPWYGGFWDGHTTDEKYARLAAAQAVDARPSLSDHAEFQRLLASYAVGEAGQWELIACINEWAASPASTPEVAPEQQAAHSDDTKCETCGGSKVDPGGLPACRDCTVPKDDNPYYGQDCPKGMVQVEFVGCSPSDKRGDYGWKPCKSTFLDIYIDGQRFYIKVGDFHDGVAERRGLHVIGPFNMSAEMTAVNAASILLPGQTPLAAPTAGAATTELEKEVSIMYQMLDDGEWAEHIAKTCLGQQLETAITKLVGKANSGAATTSENARDAARLDWLMQNNSDLSLKIKGIEGFGWFVHDPISDTSGPRFESAREAIDTAMRATRQEGE
jgi:hypothetical protein